MESNWYDIVEGVLTLLEKQELTKTEEYTLYVLQREVLKTL